MMKGRILLAYMILTGLTTCSGQREIKMGSYAYDARFLKNHGIKYVELKSRDGDAKVMIVPSWQGRMVTTSAAGDEGNSYGWVNYRFAEVGKQNDQFNPMGGKERFWLGPEGGSYSLHFANGKEQIYDNWRVPAIIDTEAFDVVEDNDTVIQFEKSTSVKNASGTVFNLNINRKVSLLPKTSIEQQLGITLSTGAKLVAYESLNKITNTGKEAWTEKGELVSIWMLSHFNPIPTTAVFILFHGNAEGEIVNDEYFGKIPADRLKAKDGILYFKIDGKLRSKLGVPPMCSEDLCYSYDSEKKVLTILRCNMPEKPGAYLNGQWGRQDAPFAGDMLNAYNGSLVEDGSIMGPFYEIGASSPGVELAMDESLLHKQETFHIQAEEAIFDPIVEKLFSVNLGTIKSQF